jgi:hypothetical protein
MMQLTVQREDLIAHLKGWNRANALHQVIEEVKKRLDADPDLDCEQKRLLVTPERIIIISQRGSS